VTKTVDLFADLYSPKDMYTTTPQNRKIASIKQDVVFFSVKCENPNIFPVKC